MRLFVGMLVLLRTATGFLPTTTTLSSRPAALRVRKLHYNSVWVQRRNSKESRRSLKAAADEESANSTMASGSDDPWASYRNKNNIRDQVVSAISKDGGIKVTACTIRNMVNDLMIQHTLTDIPIQALGRTMTCALLMANGMQAEQTVQITLNCKFGS